MSRWLDRANGLAADARNTLAAALWPLRKVLIAGAIGVPLSCAASWRVAHYWENNNAQDQLNALGDDRRLCLQNALADLELMMNTAARLFQSSAKEIDRAEFSRIIDGLRSVFDATLEIDWAPLVLRHERAPHEAVAASQGLEGYHISTRGNDGKLVPADAQDEYFPILYSTRTPTGPTLLGLDIGSDPAQRGAMTRARDSGRLAATPPAAGPGDIFLLAPVYGFDLPHDGIEDRRSNFEGFLRGSFLPGPLIDKVFRGVKSPEGLDIYFFRQGAGPNEPPFHVRSSLLRSVPAEAQPRAGLETGLHWTGEIVLADTRWTMITVPVPGGSRLVNHDRSLMVLIVGLLLTMAVISYLELARRNASRLDAMRKRLTAAVKYRSELLHAVSLAAKDLLTADTIEKGMAKVLETIGEAVRADRMLVLEIRGRAGKAPISVLRYSWDSAAAPALPSLGQMDPSGFEADPWFAPLLEGKAVTCVPGAMPDGVVKTMLQRLGIASSLDVPIVIDGQYWGRICFDDCRTEREWLPAEVDILRIAAELIGSAIIRDRYVGQLRDANTIIERSPTILFRLRGEPSLPLIYISHNVTMFGYDPAEMIASPQLYKTIIHPDDELKTLEWLARIVMEGTQSETVEFRIRTRDGTYRWVENHLSPVRDAAGRLVEIEGILTDITEKKEAADKILVLARTDALTGLANRATFIDRLRQSFAAAKRGANPFAVLYLDLDRFKDINDTLGHFAGDLLLKAVAERLNGCTRETDLVARLGGDEFAIIQTELIDVSNASVLASKILDVLGAPYPLGETEMNISASIGISPYMSETEGSDEMLAQADLALYRAKEEGRDQYCFHSADLDRVVRDRVAIANDLRHALEHNELELYYQPQIELATGRIVGMEALIRWNHPKRGLLTPGDFLPIVEKTPLIVTLGQWVLDNACKQMNAWREAGIAPPILAINLSLKQLQTGDELVGSITQTLTKWGLSPKNLELDVTESMLAHVTLHKNSVLDRLQQLGVKIAIDDFGAQYSSLDYLKTYRVSRVKIPRLMIDASTQDPEASAMVRAIIGVARELDIEVVAQGVETEAQRDLLTCVPSTTKVQGYYYSAPVRTGDATQMLRQRLIEPRLSQVSGEVAAQ